MSKNDFETKRKWAKIYVRYTEILKEYRDAKHEAPSKKNVCQILGNEFFLTPVRVSRILLNIQKSGDDYHQYLNEL